MKRLPNCNVDSCIIFNKSLTTIYKLSQKATPPVFCTQRGLALYLVSHNMTVSTNIDLQFTYFGLCLLYSATCIYPVPAVRIFHFQDSRNITNPASLSPCILSWNCKSRALPPYVPWVNPIMELLFSFPRRKIQIYFFYFKKR